MTTKLPFERFLGDLNPNFKHGMKKTRLYNIWCAMRYRCTCTKGDKYKNYGSRGITVCSEWQKFIPFMEWALEHGYKDGLTIDRRNNDGNYEPSNCRWVTMKVQNNNKRSKTI